MSVGAVRVRTSTGWRDIALTGPAGPTGPGSPGAPYRKLVFARAATVLSTFPMVTPSTAEVAITFFGGGTPDSLVSGWQITGNGHCWMSFSFNIPSRSWPTGTGNTLTVAQIATTGTNGQDRPPLMANPAGVGVAGAPAVYGDVDPAGLFIGHNATFPWWNFKASMQFGAQAGDGKPPSSIGITRISDSGGAVTSALQASLTFNYPCIYP